MLLLVADFVYMKADYFLSHQHKLKVFSLYKV